MVSEPRITLGQYRVNQLDDPILVLKTPGHSGEIRALRFDNRRGKPTLWSAGDDKVAFEWDLTTSPLEILTEVRPPIWRAQGGSIRAIAISPIPTPAGSRLLAVGGFAIEATRGTILLYNVWADEKKPTFERALVGPSTLETRTVTALEFDPTGRFLVAGRRNGEVDVWDIQKQNPKAGPVSTLTHAKQYVSSIAFTSKAGRLVTATQAERGDPQFSTIRVWAFSSKDEPFDKQPVPLVQTFGTDPEHSVFTQVAITPDDKTVVAGRFNGSIELFDIETLQSSKLPGWEKRGEVLSLSLAKSKSMNKTILATSIRPPIQQDKDFNDNRSFVEVRDFPDGELLPGYSWQLDSLARSLSISSDGQYVAFAGDNAHKIHVEDISKKPAVERISESVAETIWDIGFLENGLTVGYARSTDQRIKRNPATVVDSFDFINRRHGRIAWSSLKGKQQSINHNNVEWQLRKLSRIQFALLDGQHKGQAIQLDPNNDGEYMDHTFISPNQKHQALLLAVACEKGVMVYDVLTQKRIRVLRGHTGDVVGLAPSPDGNWLATCSSDNTIRLWTLNDFNAPTPPLGAKLALEKNGEWIIKEVAPMSHADFMGLNAGQTIAAGVLSVRGDDGRLKNVAYGGDDLKKILENDYRSSPQLLSEILRTKKGLDSLEKDVNTLPPYFDARIYIKGIPDSVRTTKSESPALSFFPSTDLTKEWILWTPQGFYDSSPQADSRYFGWHLNKTKKVIDIKDTGFLVLKDREKQLRKPDLINTLLKTANKSLAYLPPFKPTEPVSPPMASLVSAPLDPNEHVPPKPLELRNPSDPTKDRPATIKPDETVTVKIPPSKTPRKVEATLDGRPAYSKTIAAESGASFDVKESGRLQILTKDLVTLEENRYSISLSKDEPPPATNEGELRIVAIGVDSIDQLKNRSIRTAINDIEAISKFLKDHITNAQGMPFKKVIVEKLEPAKASSVEIEKVLESIRPVETSADNQSSDMVIVVIDSHFVAKLEKDQKSNEGMLAKDSSKEGNWISAGRIVETLGKIAETGCLTMLFVDCLQKEDPEAGQLSHLVNELLNRNVLVAAASIDKPNAPLDAADENSRFARGITNIFGDEADGLGLHRKDRDSLGLKDFHEVVTNLVKKDTNDEQNVYFGFPTGVDWDRRVKLKR